MDAAAQARRSAARHCPCAPNRWQVPRSRSCGYWPPVEGMPRVTAVRPVAPMPPAAAPGAPVVRPLRPSEGRAPCTPTSLSGGMARRVLLCCALIGRAEALLSPDEPTPALDLSLAPGGARDFRAFADAGGGRHAHHPRHRAGANTWPSRVAVFRDGTVVEETSVPAFASSRYPRANPFTRHLWHALPEHGFVVPTREGGPLC